MNRYGVMAWRHWARWLPRQYAAIGDPDNFFTALGEEAARQIDDLTDELTGEIGQGDSYLARVGQLVLPQPSWQQTTINRMRSRSAGNDR